MDDIDIWRSAKLLIERYPDDADLVAARRADALLDQGDVDGFHAWKRIVEAINELKRTERGESESLN
jgi:hypothetical protein